MCDSMRHCALPLRSQMHLAHERGVHPVDERGVRCGGLGGGREGRDLSQPVALSVLSRRCAYVGRADAQKDQ